MEATRCTFAAVIIASLRTNHPIPSSVALIISTERSDKLVCARTVVISTIVTIDISIRLSLTTIANLAKPFNALTNLAIVSVLNARVTVVHLLASKLDYGSATHLLVIAIRIVASLLSTITLSLTGLHASCIFSS
jgi:hypothetical protein